MHSNVWSYLEYCASVIIQIIVFENIQITVFGVILSTA